MTAQAFTINGTDSVTRAMLPPLVHETTPAFDAANLPYRVLFNKAADGDRSFTSFMIEWNDGDAFYFDEAGTNTFMCMVAMETNVRELLQFVKDEFADDLPGIHRVID